MLPPRLDNEEETCVFLYLSYVSSSSISSRINGSSACLLSFIYILPPRTSTRARAHGHAHASSRPVRARRSLTAVVASVRTFTITNSSILVQRGSGGRERALLTSNLGSFSHDLSSVAVRDRSMSSRVCCLDKDRAR